MGHRALGLVVGVGLVGCGIDEPAQVIGDHPSEKLVAAQALMPIVAEHGEVRIIVGVGADTGIARLAAGGDHRALVADAQRVMRERFVGSAGITERDAFQSMPFMVLDVHEPEGLVALATAPEVSSIEADTLVAPLLAESTAVTGAAAAWARGYTGSGYAVAVLDTGVMTSHTHLAGKIVSEACYSSSDAALGASSLCPGGVGASTAPGSAVNCSLTGCDHGTHVAAIAASGNAAQPGVARGANVVAMQVFSRFTKPEHCNGHEQCVLAFGSDWLKGLERVLQLHQSGVKIAAVNLSLGGGRYTTACDAAFPSARTAIENLASQGIATVIAAGNEGHVDAVAYPACLSSAVSVGAITKAGAVASYSNMGGNVDVLAPGSGITAAVTANTSATANKSGTSMAAPHVAGAFAVMRSAKPTLTIAEALAALQATGTPVADTRTGGTTSKNQIHVASAITAITAPTPVGCARAAPSVTVVQPEPVDTPVAVTFTVGVANHDDVACGPSMYEVTTAAPVGWTVEGATLTLDPAASGTAQVKVTPPDGLRSGATPLGFSATNVSAREQTGSGIASYTMTCAHAAPAITLIADAVGRVTAAIDNNDPATCAASAYRVTVSAAVEVTPSVADVEVAAGATGELAIEVRGRAGMYPVTVTLSRDDGTFAGEATVMAEALDAPDADEDHGVGCSSSRGSSGFALLALIASFVAARRAARLVSRRGSRARGSSRTAP